MNRNTLAIILLIVGAACVAAALVLRSPGMALAVFVVFGFMAGSLLSQAGLLAHAISPMKGHRVQVSVWGAGFLNLPQASSSLTQSRASAPVCTFFCDLTADCAAI